MIKVVYFGMKRPKVFQTVSPQMFEHAKTMGRKKGDGITYISLANKDLKYSFEPFKAMDIDDAVAKMILDCAGDLFKRVDEGENSPDPIPVIKTDGYVGDTHAERIKDLKKVIAKDKKDEEGKSIERVIDEARSGKKKM